MAEVLFAFPIDGRSVCTALQSASGLDEKWVVKSIETLAAGDAPLLGDLWQRSLSGEVIIATRDLCAALDRASQVVTFDVHLLVDEGVEIFIEDGVLVKSSLPNRPKGDGGN